MEKTKVTSKFQTTIPEEIRTPLGVSAGCEVELHIVRSFAVVKASKKLKDPIAFLTSQCRMDIDAVQLVRQAREESG